ncbi:MAG TPA: ABC transporter substrate-binding protein [Verrucomicrobiae bacterium]|jgi:ABC-type nitrate/sulfonate/bicarbonate transport system substrate-binding protein|nr:ABC transporter substrate-binding protein [Verrucomicrobiae bacterium]
MRKICFFCLLTALVFLAAPTRAAERVILGYSGVGSGEEVHHLGKKYGIFKKHGLDVEIVYIPGGSTVVQGMVSGEIQFGRGSPSEVVSANLAGFPLKIISALINKFVYTFVTPPSITKPQDLKGKNVAISRFGSGSDFITRMALKSWGLDPVKDVTILQVGNSPDRLAAMASGKVHGSILSLSQTPRAKKLGLRVLADLSQIDADYPQGVLYVTSSFIEKRPEVIRSFIKAYVEAIQMFKTNRPAAYDVIEKNTGLKDRGEIEEYHSVLTKNFLLSYPMPTVAGMKTVLDDLGSKNPKVRELKPEELIDTRFLRELKDSGAIK